MKSIKYAFILTAFCLLSNSCTKQETGPTGPQGPQGAQGPSGNFYTIIDSISAANWKAASSGNLFYYTFSGLQQISQLTSPNTSDVDVYFSQTYSPSNGAYALWTDLPVSSALIQNDNFNFSYSTYTLTILYTNSTAPANAYLYFKIIVITNP